jgi:hypothetical protein
VPLHPEDFDLKYFIGGHGNPLGCLLTVELNEFILNLNDINNCCVCTGFNWFWIRNSGGLF